MKTKSIIIALISLALIFAFGCTPKEKTTEIEIVDLVIDLPGTWHIDSEGSTLSVEEYYTDENNNIVLVTFRRDEENSTKAERKLFISLLGEQGYTTGIIDNEQLDFAGYGIIKEGNLYGVQMFIDIDNGRYAITRIGEFEDENAAATYCKTILNSARKK